MEVRQTTPSIVLQVLKWATIFLFAGRAWQHLFWDAPYRALLWDQQLMEGIVLWLRGGTWKEYATSEGADHFVRSLTFIIGVFYSFMAILTAFITSRSRKLTGFYYAGSILLVILAFLYGKEKFYHLGQMLEYAIQFSLPLLFIYAYTNRLNPSRLVLYLKIAIAITFTSHGLYAIGYYPQPGNFVDMTIHILNFSESGAKIFLKIAGVLDFLLSAALFIPAASRYALAYAVLWGGLTSLARVWANFYWDFPLMSLHQYLYETIYRLPHMMVPLAALLLVDLKFSGRSFFRHTRLGRLGRQR